ncbi:hypothetical protein [Porcincola intestinalis]|uniref:hypothetical protein n=1 Tax=Porcincola intestinalis TaxID=2606632 RepID=UPI002A833CE8|nr:hypothetical protein [Porcincola intestinalis]MDY4204213.1 hypothetical protein [Porcincola intestinalis]
MPAIASDIKRLFCSLKTYLAPVGVAVAIFFSLQDDFVKRSDWNTLSLYMYAVQASGFLVAYICCAVPYGTVFCEDLENRYFRQRIIREGVETYVRTNMLTVYCSAVLTMASGSILFWIMQVRIPHGHSIDVELYNQGRLGFLVSSGHFFIYFLMTAFRIGMFAGALAVISAFLSIYLRNKAATLSAPVLVSQILRGVVIRQMSFETLFFPYGKVFNHEAANAVLTLGISIATVVLFSFLTEWKIKRVL